MQALDVSTTELFEKHYPRICRELGGVPPPDVNFTDHTRLPPIAPLPPRHRMPYRSLDEKFVGRVDSLRQLYGSLHRDNTAVLQGTRVLVGTGGLGKTQLAIEYVHRFGAAYTGGVYWVDADRGLGTLVTQISGAAGIDVNTGWARIG